MKKYIFKKALFFCLALTGIFFSGQCFSQWVTNPAINTPISIQPFDQQDLHIVSDGDNGAIIVWQDFRNDASQNVSDVFAQRIDRNGYTRWTVNGLAICTNAADQGGPVIVSDGNYGAIISWVDMRNGNRDIYAQRVDSSGNTLWATNGVPVAVKPGTQQDVYLISDGANGAILAWQDSAAGAWDIYAQHLDGSGNATWATGGIAVCSAPLYQINPKMAEDGLGGALVTWQDFRNSNDYNIYAQRVNASGTALWATNGVGVCLSGGTQTNPKIRAGANTMSMIAWQDKRFGNDFDVYSQALDSMGAAQWTANGVIVCNATGNQSALDIATDAIQGIIIVWKDERSGAIDIYAQRLNSSGVAQWTSGGIAVASGSAPQINPNIVGDGLGGGIIVWQDSTSGSWDVKAQRLDASGANQWTANGVAVGTATGYQTSPKNVSDGQGGSIFAWQDKRSGNFDIYAHHLFSDGNPVGVEEAEIFSDATIVPNPFSQSAIIHSNRLINKNIVLKILDLSGKVVLYKNCGNESNITINREQLENGIYFYELIDEKNSVPVSKGKMIIAN